MHPKDVNEFANNVDPDQVYTVCPDLSVRKLRIITVGQLLFMLLTEFVFI